jgi:hypothetical protein
MKYAVEMGSGAIIFILHFKKDSSGIQILWRGDLQTHSMEIALMIWKEVKYGKDGGQSWTLSKN